MNPKPLEATIFEASTGTGTKYLILNYVYKTVVISFSGSGATTFVLEVSNDGVNWVNAGTYTDSSYYETTEAFKYIRGRISVAGGKTVLACLTGTK